MRAIGKYIVIEKVEEQEQSNSGLLLSAQDTKNFRYGKGKVLSVGTEVVAIKEGDSIYYDSRQEFTMIVEGEKRTVISERDVVLVS